MSSPALLPFCDAPAARVLFHFPDGTHASYGDTARAAARFARALLRLGVREGDRVAVQVEKSAQAIALYLGCLQAGFVYVPLNPAYTAAELEYLLDDSAPRVMVCTPPRAPELAALTGPRGIAQVSLGRTGGGTLAEAAAAESHEPLHAAGDASRIAAIVYTSGTTGRSKGAMLTLHNLEFGARTLARAWHFEPRDVLLHVLPIFHVHGLFIALGCVLASGSAMMLLGSFDEDAVFAALPACTVMMGVPTHYVRLLGDARLGRETTAGMRLFVSGSAPLLPDTFRAWSARTGQVLLERYGMTETSVIASNPYAGDRREGMVGRALPGTELRVVDPIQHLPLPAGEVGAVVVRGPHVFAGYWRKPEQTQQETTRDGFFVTGDLGVLEPDGTLQLVGRGKDLIITGGLNVYPKEVESELDALPGVVESAVVGLPHDDYGEAVTAFVVPGHEPPTAEQIAQALAGKLAKYKHPKRIEFLPTLPRNTMGKVLKGELRAQHRSLYRST